MGIHSSPMPTRVRHLVRCSVEHDFYCLTCFAVQCGALPLAVPQVSNDYVVAAEACAVLSARYALGT
jgi:hypothetical protein